MLDGYSHIGLPRFQSAELCLANMDASGIDAAVVCPFEACPDLAGVHRALTIAPDRFRALGLGLGDTAELIEQGIRAQLDAGFDGFRLMLERIVAFPTMLDAIGERGGIAMPVGGNGLAMAAKSLLGFLERYPTAMVLAPHMAGVASPAVFGDATVKALFSHPRFNVVLTRQSRFPDIVVEEWVRALVGIVGWDRLMWGSEQPVLFWRDDNIGAAANWFERLLPGDAEKDAFFHRTAQRVIFDRPRQPVSDLSLPYDPFAFELSIPAPMWAHGFPADTRLPAPLVERWMAAGGPAKEPLSAFASRLMLDAIERSRT
jgi:hypothetical protein